MLRLFFNSKQFMSENDNNNNLPPETKMLAIVMLATMVMIGSAVAVIFLKLVGLL